MREAAPGSVAELAELCRVYDVGLELIDASDDFDALLERVLDEYERRLDELRDATIADPAQSDDEARKLRALVMFATQAAALKEKCAAAAEARRAERLAGVMQALSVLSHKINNPLTSLLGRAQMLALRDDTDPYVKNSCVVIEESSRRIAEYVRELAEVVREGREESVQRLLDTERPEA